MQIDPFLIESGRVVPLPNLIWVDGRLVEDRLAEIAYVLEVHLGDFSPKIVEQMSEGRRFTHRIKGAVPVGNHQNKSSASTQYAFELAQRRDRVG